MGGGRQPFHRSPSLRRTYREQGDNQLPVTRNDVAAAAGVSPSVVSYVLNGGPRPVSVAARQRVLDAVSLLGYRPNGLARSLKTGQTNTLGLILPDASNPFFAELARGIEDRAYEAGKSVLVCNSADDTVRERFYLETLVEKRVDGIILVSASWDEDLSDVLSRKVPVVTMDRYRAESQVSTVLFDNEHAGYEVTRHLLGHGHRRLALISGPRTAPVSSERLEGCRQAMGPGAEALLVVHDTAFSLAGGYRAAESLLSGTDTPTAIVCSSDVQAIGASAALRNHGMRIPEDVALGSIDGTALAEYSSPSLTAVAQPIARMADLAVQSVLGREAKAHHTLKGMLLIGKSCGCQPGPRPTHVPSSV
ncbi:LacI family DNA-binding transcriptional regulator [Paenarthrobacter sp. NyZ202]|uniref:LacI family DNA-binding transcriptional regulator n=1 Tax=Paenarthrobacter sp. NyZ202 TaxID=3402689 RepID=UPI003CF7BD55